MKQNETEKAGSDQEAAGGEQTSGAVLFRAQEIVLRSDRKLRGMRQGGPVRVPGEEAD